MSFTLWLSAEEERILATIMRSEGTRTKEQAVIKAIRDKGALLAADRTARETPGAADATPGAGRHVAAPNHHAPPHHALPHPARGRPRRVALAQGPSVRARHDLRGDLTWVGLRQPVATVDLHEAVVTLHEVGGPFGACASERGVISAPDESRRPGPSRS